MHASLRIMSEGTLPAVCVPLPWTPLGLEYLPLALIISTCNSIYYSQKMHVTFSRFSAYLLFSRIIIIQGFQEESSSRKNASICSESPREACSYSNQALLQHFNIDYFINYFIISHYCMTSESIAVDFIFCSLYLMCSCFSISQSSFDSS